jgi:hypothetical protein
MCVVSELRAVDLITSHQFEEEIGDASSENWLFIVKMEFSVRTPPQDNEGHAMSYAAEIFIRFLEPILAPAK